MLDKSYKENLIKQKGISLWLTGLPASGKTTIANLLEKKLHDNNVLVKIIDGDKIRAGINKDLGFSISDRTENIRRVAGISKEFNDCAIIVINCFVSPTNEIRALAKEIIGSDSFYEIYVQCPLEICEKRDPKGLYKKARSGEIDNFTGISSVYEEPDNPDITIHTGLYSQEESLKELFNFVKSKINFEL